MLVPVLKRNELLWIGEPMLKANPDTDVALFRMKVFLWEFPVGRIPEPEMLEPVLSEKRLSDDNTSIKIPWQLEQEPILFAMVLKELKMREIPPFPNREELLVPVLFIRVLKELDWSWSPELVAPIAVEPERVLLLLKKILIPIVPVPVIPLS